MLAFGKLPVKGRTPLIRKAIQQGIDFFFSIDPATAKYPTGFANQPSGNWWKFGFPVFYVADILLIAEMLARLGYGSDPRLSNTLNLICDKQDSEGRWPLEYDYAGKTWVDFGKKKQPNKWVTLRALRTLRALNQDILKELLDKRAKANSGDYFAIINGHESEHQTDPAIYPGCRPACHVDQSHSRDIPVIDRVGNIDDRPPCQKESVRPESESSWVFCHCLMGNIHGFEGCRRGTAALCAHAGLGGGRHRRNALCFLFGDIGKSVFQQVRIGKPFATDCTDSHGFCSNFQVE
jgi:hypothetical protein